MHVHACSHPDVFMESYLRSEFAPIFFMMYMFVTFYYFNNVVSLIVCFVSLGGMIKITSFIIATCGCFCQIQKCGEKEVQENITTQTVNYTL